MQDLDGASPEFEETGVPPFPIELDASHLYYHGLHTILDQVRVRLQSRSVSAIVHRIVHGGHMYFATQRIDDTILKNLRSYIPLAPLYQPFAVETIDLLLGDSPEPPQIVCFDTAFHPTVPQLEQMLMLPYEARRRGLRRYGFQGLSYAYLSIALSARHAQVQIRKGRPVRQRRKAHTYCYCES
ncbi:MAG: hypothetical protein ABI155_15210 [Paralcaligenes sp.]